MLIKVIETYPESPIYHYGSFELTAFERLSKKHKTRVEAIKKTVR
jgi:predicted RecB family nuclease